MSNQIQNQFEKIYDDIEKFSSENDMNGLSDYILQGVSESEEPVILVSYLRLTWIISDNISGWVSARDLVEKKLIDKGIDCSKTLAGLYDDRTKKDG